MAARLKIYVDWFNKRLQLGSKNAGAFTMPKLFQGDNVPFQIHILEPDPAGTPNKFVNVDVSSMALKFAISDTPTGTSGSPTPFVTQFSWSKDTNENFFYGTVNFATSELNTYLGESDEKTAWLELEITESANVTTIYQGQVTIRAEVNETATVEVAPGETALSLEVAEQMFAKKYMNNGESITFPSEDGTKVTVIYTHNDGSFRTETY